MFVTSLHLVSFLSALVHCPSELWLSPASELVFHPELCFQPLDQDELLLAMTFFFRSVICCLPFLLSTEEEVDGDLRPISLIDLKWQRQFLLLRVPQKTSSSMSCPSSSISSSRSRSCSQFPAFHLPCRVPNPLCHTFRHRTY